MPLNNRFGLDQTKFSNRYLNFKIFNKRSLFVILFFIFFLPTTVKSINYISQGFLTNEKISLGSIVALEADSTDKVTAVTTKNVENIFGIAVNESNSPITLTNNQDNQIQVATGGIVQVLVSDINGDIQQGDQITASPIKGVGMKATSNTKVVGIAQGKPSGSTKQSYVDEYGNKQFVILGEVPILVSVAYFYKEPDKTIIPQSIQNLANALAGKKVSSLPIIISSAIFIITLIVVVSIIYAMIRSSIISVGRNPMSQSAIYRDVIQLSALVLAILAVALISIYVILTRF